MSTVKAPVEALTKQLRDDRTATVTVEWDGRYGSTSGTVVTVARIGRKVLGSHCGAHHLRPNLPTGHVAAVGPLCLTQAESDQVKAVYDAFEASLPRDLHGERRVLVSRIREAEDVWADTRAANWDAFDGGGNPFSADAANEHRIAEARSELTAFDATYPEIAAEVAAERAAAVDRAALR